MALVFNKLPFCFLAALMLGVFAAGQSQNSPMQGLQQTMHQIAKMEDYKLEAISAFLSAIFMMIGLLPQAMVQMIGAKIQFDVNLINSMIKGFGGNDASIQSILTSLQNGVSQFQKSISSSAGSGSSFNFKGFMDGILGGSGSGSTSGSGSGSASGSGSSSSGSGSGSLSGPGSGSLSGSGSGSLSGSGSGSSSGSGSGSSSGGSGGASISGQFTGSIRH